MSSSDSDEAPAEVSFQTAKTAISTEQELIRMQKNNEKQEAKLKRRLREEVFRSQKIEKVARDRHRKANLASSILDDLRLEMATNPLQAKAPLPSSDDSRPVEDKSSTARVKRSKVYRDLNIEVTTVSRPKTDRPSAATAFRDKRLAKVPRENVSMNLIHREKLVASDKY